MEACATDFTTANLQEDPVPIAADRIEARGGVRRLGHFEELPWSFVMIEDDGLKEIEPLVVHSGEFCGVTDHTKIR